MILGLRGRYRLIVRQGGHLVRRSPWFDNLITDAGLELIGTHDA